MLARWTGEVFPGAPDYAGYSMAAASFFAFAYALNQGSHIRVSILLNALGRHGGGGARSGVSASARCLATYFAWYAVRRDLLVVQTQ